MKTIRLSTAALMITLIGFMNSSGFAATVSVPPLPKKTYTKAAVKWPTLSATSAYAFAAPCGQTANICATVTPARLAPKFSWVDPAGVLAISAGTDPGCNAGQGGFLTVGGPATGCAPGQQVIAAKLNGKVVSTGSGVLLKLDAEPVSTAILPKTKRTKFGVGEKVSLTLLPAGLSPITWSNAGGGALDATSGGNVGFTADEHAGTPSVTATFLGIPINVAFEVVEPASESAVKITCPSNLSISYSAGTLGSGMCLAITVAPTDVSFENLQYREVSGPASNVFGYIADFIQLNPQIDMSHHPADWLPIDVGNEEIDRAAFTPNLWNPPWYAGGWQWDIPLEWRVGTSATVTATLPHRLQQFSVIDSTGTSSVSKLGQIVTRTP